MVCFTTKWPLVLVTWISLARRKVFFGLGTQNNPYSYGVGYDWGDRGMKIDFPATSSDVDTGGG